MLIFHLIAALGIVLVAVTIMVGDEIIALAQNLGWLMDPAHRELIKICQEARKP